MQIFFSISFLIIFTVWLQYELKKNNKLSNNKNEEYRKREAQANLVRRGDISSLSYITIPLQQLPLADMEDPTVNSYRDTILSLSEKRIINLSGHTNTELKLKYGVTNIATLTEYENNYIILVSNLQKWADRLYSNGNITESVAVLEFAVQCHSEVRDTYRLLAKIYHKLNTPEKIDDLLEALSLIIIPDSDKLANELSKMKSS